METKMKKVLLSMVALVLLVPVLGFAADVRQAEVVAKDAKVKNLYLAGQNPTVDANVTGDLVAAGANLTVNGDVTGSVLAAGGNLNLNGAVAQSVRVAGSTVNIESVVGGDVIVFGGTVIFGTKSVVNGDVIIMGGTVDMKGKVLGSIKNSYVGNLTLAGAVTGDVSLGQVGTLNVAGTAVVGGVMKYSSQREATVATDAKVGSVEYTKVSAPAKAGYGDNAGSIIFGMLMAFVTLLVFIKVMPKFAGSVVHQAVVNPWAKMGVGFLAMFVTPVVMLLLLLTFFGWGVMGYLFMAYGAILALTGTFTALLAGSFVWKYFRKESELTVSWKTAAIGVVLVAAAKMIPVIGWIAAFMVALIVFGTLATMSYEYIKAQRA